MTHLRTHLILLILMLLSAAPADVSAGEQLIGARRPCPAPDGSTVAFDYQGDIWTAPISGGSPRRLTANEAYDYGPIFSPHGTWIAFSSDREGNGDIYIVPAEGGLERRITYHSAWDYILGWSADGRAIYFESFRYDRHGTVYRISLDGGLPVPVIHGGIQEAAVHPSGEQIAVSFGSCPWWRKHYVGSGGGELWTKEFETGEWRRITESSTDERFPCWSAAGDSLFFVMETDSIPNLHCLDLATGVITGLTSLKKFGTRFPRSSAGIITYESGRRLYRLDPPYDQPLEIVLNQVSGCRGTETRFIEQKRASGFSPSPDDRGLAVIARGQLIGFPVTEEHKLLSPKILLSGTLRTAEPSWDSKGGRLAFSSDQNGTWDIYLLESTEKTDHLILGNSWTASQLTTGSESDRSPAFSPDGKWVAFIRDNRQLCVVPAKGGDVSVLHDRYNLLNFSWSPDGRYIAFSATTLEWREDVFIVPLGGEDLIQVTQHPNDDFQPLWDPQGRWLTFASRTAEGDYALKMVMLTQEEFEKTREDRLLEKLTDDMGDKDKTEKKEKSEVSVVVEKADIHRRIRTITTVDGQYYRYALSPDGEMLAFKADTYDGYDLFVVDIWGEERKQVTSGGIDPQEFTWDSKSKRIYYRTESGLLHIIDSGGKDKKNLSFSVRLRIDAATERHQMLDEAWRLLRDGFYDAEMHGVDWQEVHSIYAELIDPCGTEPEFYNLLREMIGELGASHLGIWRKTSRPPGTGELGIVPDETYQGPGLRVANVVPRSPAWQKRSRLYAGDILTAIDGQPLRSHESDFGLLQGTDGKRVSLTVHRDSKEQNISIRPVVAGALRNLLREAEVERNRAYVDSLSEDRVGYLYVRAMGHNDWLRFQRDFLAYNFHKESLIIDVRGNSGGRIHNQILDMLTGKAHAYRIERNGYRIDDPLLRWEKPLVVLIDDGSYSDGEIFPWAIKTLGIGTLIGVPTNGSVIGTTDVELLDGTTFRIPRTGWWTISEEDMENNGVKPDIHVERAPEEHNLGHDSQLERAVHELIGAE